MIPNGARSELHHGSPVWLHCRSRGVAGSGMRCKVCIDNLAASCIWRYRRPAEPLLRPFRGPIANHEKVGFGGWGPFLTIDNLQLRKYHKLRTDIVIDISVVDWRVELSGN